MYHSQARELLRASWTHLKHNVAPALQDQAELYEQTLVTINLLQMVEREMEHRPSHLKSQWSRLNAMQDIDLPLPSDWEEAVAALHIRNRELCHDIRAGRYEEPFMQEILFEHLLATTMEQLQVANPDYLQRRSEEAPD
ncbi:MAG: DUF6285 domain-containing protein [Anaerolineae bacterium]|nr:DUF6285 domain-containing protein [Anaerolineae bacterium]